MTNKPIVLQFSTERGISSWAIRAFEHGCAFSHVDFVLSNGSLLGARYEPSYGVQLRQPGYAKFSRTQLVSLPATEDVWQDCFNWLESQIGKPYDSRAIAAFAFNRDWRARDSWFCSELIAAALERAWFPRKLCSPTNRIDPGDLFLLVTAFPNVVLDDRSGTS